MAFVDQLTGRERTIGYDQELTISGRIAVNGLRILSTGSYIAVVVDNVRINNANAIYLSARRSVTVGGVPKYEWDYGVTINGITIIMGTEVVDTADLWHVIDVDATGTVHAEETLVEYYAVDGYKEVWKPGSTNGILVTVEGTIVYDNRFTVPAGVYTNVPVYYAPYFFKLEAGSTNPYLYDNSLLNPVWRSRGAACSATVTPFGDGWTAPLSAGPFSGSAGSSDTFTVDTEIPPPWTNDETFNDSGPKYSTSFIMDSYFPSHEISLKGRIRNMSVTSDVPHDLFWRIGASGSGGYTHTETGVIGEDTFTATVGGFGMTFNVAGGAVGNVSKTSFWDNAGAEMTGHIGTDYRAGVALATGPAGQNFFWRLPAKDSISIQQAASMPLYPVTWAVGAGANQWHRTSGGTATLSVVASPGGTALRIEATSATATNVTATFSPGFRVSYRWYTLRVRSVGSANVAFNFGATTVTTGADGVWIDVEKDVLDFLWYSRQLPITNALTLSVPIQIPGNKTIEIESVAGTRKYTSSVTPISTTQLGLFHGFTDGYLSLRVVSVTTIAQFVTAINAETATSGWSATSLRVTGTVGTDLWTDNQVLGIIEGQGFDNSGAMAVDIVTPATLQAKPTILGQIIMYPGAGDVQGTSTGTYGFETDLIMDYHTGAMATATLRGNESATVNLTVPSLSNEDRGSGSGGVDGKANTGAPFARVPPVIVSIPQHRIKVDVPGTIPWVMAVLPSTGFEYVNWDARRVQRFWNVFDVPPSLDLWLSMDTSPTGRLVQATTASGKIVLRHPLAYGVTTWNFLVTTITGTRPTARYSKRGTTGALLLAYEASGGISFVTTIDEGVTFSVATTITSTGKLPTLAETPTGSRAFAWWVTGGAIKFKTLDAFGGVEVAELTAVASSVAEDAIGLVCRSDGSFVLAYHNTGGAIVTVVSTNGGTTWA